MSFLPVNSTVGTQRLLEYSPYSPSLSASPVRSPPSQWAETLPHNTANIEHSDREEAAPGREVIGEQIPGVAMSHQELQEVLRMVDEAAAAEADLEARQHEQSQISTASEESIDRPLVSGKEKVSAPADEHQEGVAAGVVTRSGRASSNPKKPSQEPRRRAPPKPRAKRVAKATKAPQKEAASLPAAPKLRAAASKATRRKQKESRVVTPPPTQSTAGAQPPGSSPVNLLSPDSQTTLKLPERPSPHASKKQKNTPEPRAPPKFLLKSTTYYHGKQVDS